jgi:hypothetical protein
VVVFIVFISLSFLIQITGPAGADPDLQSSSPPREAAPDHWPRTSDFMAAIFGPPAGAVIGPRSGDLAFLPLSGAVLSPPGISSVGCRLPILAATMATGGLAPQRSNDKRLSARDDSQGYQAKAA